jgi:site-specific DNA-methyltransferase (adenine-specific)
VTVRILTGDCRSVLWELGAKSFDAAVTDPPYELGFMGKAWDRDGVALDPNTWTALYCVLKPGAYLLAFGGTRTYHRMTSAIEDVGFEIHDCISWLYGSGFPKHRSKLKPAWEPIVVARKPGESATPLQIDACRIPFANDADENESKEKNRHADFGTEPGGNQVYGDFSMVERRNYDAAGRWPANVAIDEAAAELIDAQSGDRAAGNFPSQRAGIGFTKSSGGQNSGTSGEQRSTGVGGASRFYYCAKASREERDFGCEGFARGALNWSSGTQSPGTFQSDGTDKTARNNHPTIKPRELMRWLVRLVTPPGGHVVDPFAGSGTTGMAAIAEGFSFTGIERDARYAAISRARCNATQPSLFAAATP